MANAKFRVKNGLIVDEVASNSGNFTILDGTVTSDAGITLATGSDGNIALSPDAGGKVTIDEPLQVSPATSVYVDATVTSSGGSSDSRTTLTLASGSLAAFPSSGSVYIEGTTSAENPYAYTGKTGTTVLTGFTTLDNISSALSMITLAPEAVDINGKAAVTSQTGEMPADGGQVTIDGGKWGNAANDWAIGKNYGSVILNQASSFMKVKTSDLDSAYTYKDTIHQEVVPIVKIGSEVQNTLTLGTEYFTGYFAELPNGGSAGTRNETLLYNHIVHVDTLALSKIKSSVQNTESAYSDALGAAMVIETATHGELNQLVFNFDNVNGQRWQNAGSGTLGKSNYAYSVGSVFKPGGSGTGGTNPGTFGMGYMNRSFNQVGASLASGPFTSGSTTYGAEGNPLATENTFFQANSSGHVALGPSESTMSNAVATFGSGTKVLTGIDGVEVKNTRIGPSGVYLTSAYNAGVTTFAVDDGSGGAASLGSFTNGTKVYNSSSQLLGSVSSTASQTVNITSTAYAVSDNDQLHLVAGASIIVQSGATAPISTTSRLYNKGGSLYWGTTDLSASSASAFGDLSDVTYATSGGSSGDLTISGLDTIISGAIVHDSSGKITLDSHTGDIALAAGGTDQLVIDMDTTGGQIDITLGVDEDNLVFKAHGGAAILTLDDDGSASFGSNVAIGGGYLLYGNTSHANFGVGDTAAGTPGKNLTISAGSSTAASTNTDGGDLILKAGGGDGTGTSYMSFRTKVNGTDSVAERMRIHTDGSVHITNVTASSATQGGHLKLIANDGVLMADDHRLGVIEFAGAEDGSNNISVGARIQAIARDAWDGSNNDADLQFYTTDGTTESLALTLDADNLATFAGDVTISGNDLTFGNGATIVNTSTSVLTITEAQTNFSGDIQVGGQDIKASDGTTAITLTNSGGVGVAENLTVAGNLTVSGTTTAVQTTNMQVEDALIELGLVDGSAPSSTTTWDSGIIANYYASSAKKAGFYWDASATSWALTEVIASESGTQVLTPTAGATEMRYLYDETNYYSIGVAAAGATTLTTLGSGTTDSHLTLDVDGDLILDTATGINRFYKNGDTDDYTSITVAANGVTTFATFDADASIGHLTFDVDGDVILDPATGVTVFKDNGTTYGAQDHANVTVAQGAGVTVDTFLCTTYQATKYLILVSDQDNNNFMTCELLVLGDDVGSGAHLTQYGVVYNDATDKDLGVFTATENNDTITLTYTANDTANASSVGHKVRAVATRLAAH